MFVKKNVIVPFVLFIIVFFQMDFSYSYQHQQETELDYDADNGEMPETEDELDSSSEQIVQDDSLQETEQEEAQQETEHNEEELAPSSQEENTPQSTIKNKSYNFQSNIHPGMFSEMFEELVVNRQNTAKIQKIIKDISLVSSGIEAITQYVKDNQDNKNLALSLMLFMGGVDKVYEITKSTQPQNPQELRDLIESFSQGMEVAENIAAPQEKENESIVTDAESSATENKELEQKQEKSQPVIKIKKITKKKKKKPATDYNFKKFTQKNVKNKKKTNVKCNKNKYIGRGKTIKCHLLGKNWTSI